MVRKSINWIEGAGLGGRSLAGRNGKRDGGGWRRRLMARTMGDQSYNTRVLEGQKLTTSIKWGTVRHDR